MGLSEEQVAGERRAYVLRDAGSPSFMATSMSGAPRGVRISWSVTRGSPSRMGKVYKVYPYTPKALLEAIDDARFRSYTGTPQLVVRVEGKERAVIRRFETGREVPVSG
jgi:hypothetical protein